ncbi:MAG: YdcF family protein [Eubacteriales bacterium]|nr:YdcF family protein [Eubacteriales bacterium]
MRRKRKGIGLLLALVVLLGAIVAARRLLAKPEEPAAVPALTAASPTTTPTPAATAAPETPQPTPTPQAAPARSYPLVRGYSEKTYRLVSDLVYTYAAKQDAGIAELLRTLEELKAEDVAMEAQWHEILDYWRYVNKDFVPQPGEIPEGLAEDDSLCIVVLGFQLEPDGGMAAELTGRCETALKCLERYPRALLAVTGGGTALGNRSVTEAGTMAAWFSEHGVEPERILQEDRSLTTADNAVFTGALLRERAPQVRQLLIVSSDYHLPLGCLLFEEKAILYAYAEGTKPFSVAGWAAWDSGGRFLPDTPQQQKVYLWSVADPKY